MRNRIALSVLILLAGWASDAVAAEPVLKVGTAGDYKPLTWQDPLTGTYEGRAIDLISTFAKDKGYRIQFVKTTWPDLMKDLTDGDFQVAVGGISSTPGRAEKALMSQPVARTGKVALVRCGEQGDYESLKEIDQPSVRVVENRGGTNEKFALARLKHAILIIVPNNQMPFDYLKRDKADVMFTDSIEAVYLEDQNSGLCAVFPDKPYTHSDKVFLFAKDETALQQEFNGWLAHRK
ncbi:transporter substrate-binding domain-containing protein [Roseibium sp. RKSG952]|uniref:transporter substrate-binding domain-containing protein n=1 Tax=Roseibium sp. RKSG952 TaxID=2529384 RepID=UPI0012BC7317|nr:transporter substrate-binding domain-containing protein [Roseibium sp. RKSG952]MTH95433.1 transporter substrate-binding domain-containing protein [Roseibium sp. RKSG952]